MKRNITRRTILLILFVMVTMVTACTETDVENLPELEYEIEEYINNGNFNNWKIGITVSSPRFVADVLPMRMYTGNMIVSEEGVELTNGGRYSYPSEELSETRTERKEAWSMLESCGTAEDYIGPYCERFSFRYMDYLLHVEQYVIAFHCWNNRREEGEDIEYNDGIFLIYEDETKEIEYLARVRLNQDYVYEPYSLFWAVDVEEIE